MIRKAVISLVAALAAVLAFSVGTSGHSASHHAPSAAAARAALVRYLRTYSPTSKWPAGLKPGETRVGPAAPSGSARSITQYKSFNWGGYASWTTTAQTYTKVSGSWKVPTLTCSAEDRLTAIWVGIDGFETTTVEQLGTLDWCFEGKAHYYDWYEMYPSSSVEVGKTLKAGDSISASVSRSGDSYTLKLTDSTRSGENISHTATCALTTCLDESAEWIVERPAFSIGITPLAQIGKATFTSASTTAKGKSDVISKSPDPSEIQIYDATATYALWSPSGLNSSGNSFSGTWKNSY
jgi:Peptidase A4 family